MQPEQLLEAVDHVQIPVRDKAGAAEWYSQTLGFKIQAIGGPGDDQAFLELPRGPLICLWETEGGTHSHFIHRGAPRPSLFFKVHAPGMAVVYARLVGSGATIGLKPESWEYGAGETMKFMMF